MDFITGLPNVKGCFKIWVVVDYITKMAHFIPLKTQSAKELANSFVNQIWRLHGLPEGIVLDRDAIFTGNFWADV